MYLLVIASCVALELHPHYRNSHHHLEHRWWICLQTFERNVPLARMTLMILKTPPFGSGVYGK
ncbi:MAG: hypothetical protein H6629_11990 [Calditrichae bacterium]|nr:hypothetical protein [Calditrichia bacterium]